MKRNAPMTVGEMIAAHHWRDALDNARRAEQAFHAMPLGAALRRYENALASAWQADCREGISDRALDVAWDRAKQAECEFRTLLAIATREAT